MSPSLLGTPQKDTSGFCRFAALLEGVAFPRKPWPAFSGLVSLLMQGLKQRYHLSLAVPAQLKKHSNTLSKTDRQAGWLAGEERG